ncbi:MAG: type IV conjugative transfer system protein TraE [Candidatus Accumulibacter meliphilus]|jgi:conjugal transfer pilus assembly protein TraE|uniref:type IV conjugative transfer system protein TraE n=1 Tax=Candidatus Accumulibacter meliphilus TaxID=2211374 RepID=UPI002FC33556
MRLRTFTSERDNHRAEITFMRIAVGGLVLALLANAGALLGVAGSERTVLVPPEVQKSFWVSDQKVSGDYLQEMAYWYAGLALNITPHVAEYQKNLFLKYTAPSEYGRLQAEFDARTDFLRKKNASTQFSAQSVMANEPAMIVALAGVLMTWVGDKKASEKQTTYVVGFRYRNGRLHVSEFRETSDRDPFGADASSR